MDYFFWFSIFFGFMVFSFLERLLFGCFSVEDENNSDNKNTYTYTFDNEIKDLEAEEKVNTGVFGRTNSESKIIIRRRKLVRSKTI